ncbi:amidohydrolase family protein [Pelagicoccus sp. SDUM812003]|uniref:amidohydrolase family protein n=1 Tax=Pelagicoccus sp. SDUM812003 TaxID=3041267 RepID=UPI00280F0E43|nr:amidohydrolase family protein [Pelagicoccus sp. SDUM812003]MDQ8205458.1 amidohydrolase family protein [Pelagicoccus sp. SDUM812003]
MLVFYNDDSFQVLRGRFLNPQTDTQCQYLRDALLIGERREDGCRIVDFGDATSLAERYGWDLDRIPCNPGLILPPFYDLHFHWVQDDVRDAPKVSLLEWLERYTFPEEARFADADYAEIKAKAFWRRIHSLGTVGGLCYSSIHDEALDAAMRHAPAGFHIGGVLMTMNCPALLRQSKQEAIEAAKRGAASYGSRYCVTPRFAPTTHPEVMKAGAGIARENDLFQQTHLDETLAEIDWVLGIYEEFEGFQDVGSYTEIYQRCDMLGPKTVMGHAIHLSEDELELLAQSDTAIASCPTSNAPTEVRGLGSGLFNFEQVESAGIRWGLASDIGGGPYLSMFDVIDSFVSQNREAGRDGATYAKALYRSTLAGAEILQVAESKGNFAPGKSFDCIHCPLPDTAARLSSAETLLPVLIAQASARSQRDELVETTVLEGKQVFSRPQLLLSQSKRGIA